MPDSPGRGRLTRLVAESIRQQVHSGYWPAGTRLPPDAELARHHGVGVNTVRRALGGLVADGLLQRGRGAGTRVTHGTTASGPARLIGVFVPSRRRIFPDIVTGADAAARQAGARTVIRTTEFDRDKELSTIDELLTHSPAGLVVVPTLEGLIDTDDYLRRLGSLDLPVVIAERAPPEAAVAGVSAVATDVHHAGYLAVQHLHQIGRRRLGLMSSRGTATSGDFHLGYVRATHQLELTSSVVMSQRPVRRRVLDKQLYDYAHTVREQRLDGIVCLGAARAAQLLPQLRKVGLTVPDDVAVVAYQDETVAPEIPLSSIVPPRDEVGRMAVQMLLRQLDIGPGAPTARAVLAPSLVVRASTVPPVSHP